MSRSKIKTKYILEMGLEWCWIFVPSLIPIATLPCDKLRGHMFLPLMCWWRLHKQVWRSWTIVCRPSLGKLKRSSKLPSAKRCWFNKAAQIVCRYIHNLQWRRTSWLTSEQSKSCVSDVSNSLISAEQINSPFLCSCCAPPLMCHLGCGKLWSAKPIL